MPPSDVLSGEPADTREAIMQATYRALCEHGYADLTIQKIGDEFPKSKSLLYHHYDGKDDLLVEFLEFMLDRFEADVPAREVEDPAAGLRSLLDHALPAAPDEEREEFARAMVELRAQAAHDPEYREHFARSDRVFHRRIADVVREGVADGTFRDVDPDRVADLLLTAIDGAMLRRTTTDDGAAIQAVRQELDEYVDRRLLAGDR